VYRAVVAAGSRWGATARCVWPAITHSRRWRTHVEIAGGCVSFGPALVMGQQAEEFDHVARESGRVLSRMAGHHRLRMGCGAAHSRAHGCMGGAGTACQGPGRCGDACRPGPA
jgi:hypothetical protein